MANANLTVDELFSDKTTVVEEGTHFKGSFSSNCPMVIRGKIEGDITAPSLTVSKTGAVHGTVKVREIQSGGELAGEFDADAVELSGIIKDKTIVRARSLSVNLSSEKGKLQIIFGENAHAPHETPSRKRS